MELSNKILRLMSEQGYSYETLERATGISRSTLQRKISAAPNKLKLTEIERIAAALGESAQDLLGWRRVDDDLRHKVEKEIETLMPAELEKLVEYIHFLKSIRVF